MPDDEPEVGSRLVPAAQEQYIHDVRSNTAIMANPEQLQLHIRKLEDSKEVPNWRMGVYGVVGGAVSAAAAWREFLSSDEYSLLIGVFFTAVASATGLYGLMDLIHTFRRRKERSITAEDVVRAIVESSRTESAPVDDVEAPSVFGNTELVAITLMLVLLLLAFIFMVARQISLG